MPLPNAVEFPGPPGPEFVWDGVSPSVLARYGNVFDVLTRCQKVAREWVEFFESARTLLGDITALGVADRAALPPFPLPGDLAPMKIEHLAPALAAAEMILAIAQQARPELGSQSIDTTVRRIARSG